MSPAERRAAERLYNMRADWCGPVPAPRKSAAPDVPPPRPLDGTTLGLDEEARGSLGTEDQLAALGAQNYVLDLNAHMSFFVPAFKRHTNFATEVIEHPATLEFGKSTSVAVDRRGDLLGDVHLEVVLPALGVEGAWVDAIGYALFTRVRLVIGDVVLHNQERLWYDIHDRLMLDQGRKAGVDAMIGRGSSLSTLKAHTLLVPLKFACCSQSSRERRTLPMCALHRSVDIRVEVDAEGLERCAVVTGALPRTAKMTCKLLTTQVTLDDEERRQCMRARHEIMFHTEQDMDSLNYSFDDTSRHDVRSVSVELRELNLPVKALAFVVYEESAAVRSEFFRYLDCVRQATLYVGSRERMAARAGAYFSLVQTYQHGRRCTEDGVHMYSFAMDAAAYQPTGALNFAVVDAPVLRVDLDPVSAPLKIKAFAVCVNWIVVEGGSLTVRFSGT